MIKYALVSEEVLTRAHRVICALAPMHDAVSELGEALTRTLDLEQLSRELAVAGVDTYHGFTMEFAPSPAAHREEYDMTQFAIQKELERRAHVVSEPEWTRVIDHPAPMFAGIYRVMYPGDSESIDGHTIYEYGDYAGWAEWVPATAEELAEDPTYKGHWVSEHDEESEWVFAYFGPFNIPPNPVR